MINCNGSETYFIENILTKDIYTIYIEEYLSLVVIFKENESQ